MDEGDGRDGAEELLRRALLDQEARAAAALRVGDLPLSDTLTVIFHGRRDLGTIQTYVAAGGHGAGSAVGAGDLLRVPCDLDLAEAEDREEAERLYPEQARALRDALPAGIACAQQDVARVYPLPDDPERCLDDFRTAVADHARALAQQIEHQEASVERFLELNGGEPPP